MELVIGTKKWSTWSLRPWLVIKRSGLPFTETLVELRQENNVSEAEVLQDPRLQPRRRLGRRQVGLEHHIAACQQRLRPRETHRLGRALQVGREQLAPTHVHGPQQAGQSPQRRRLTPARPLPIP